MPLADPRDTILFLPVIRGNYPIELTRKAKAAMQQAAKKLGLRAIFPDDSVGNQGLISTDADVRAYHLSWREQLFRIQALVAFSGDFMRERAVQDTVRLLPEDVPSFLIVNNDPPSGTREDRGIGDSLCGSLSVHHNLRMLSRPLARSCRIDVHQPDLLEEILGQYVRIADGMEALRNIRLAMIGVNPDAFATTFNNQSKLFELGISLHTYEPMTLWGDVVLGRCLQGDADVYDGPFGQVKLTHPIRKDDERVDAIRKRMAQVVQGPEDETQADTIARALLWVQDVFEADRIDAGAVHCWPEFSKFFGIAPCSFSMLSNVLLEKPVVCEGDLGHAAMARLAWAMTGQAGTILDVNNNGWDRRVFNVFHCSQTPVNWLTGPKELCGGWASVHGAVAPGAFTGISASTSSEDFHAVIYQGRMLPDQQAKRGSSGWAFVPNFPDVLEEIEQAGIHHFVAMKGLLGPEVADVLSWRGLDVVDLSAEVPDEKDVLEDLPDFGDDTEACKVYSR
jgi:L-fucose isomerase-like protein